MTRKPLLRDLSALLLLALATLGFFWRIVTGQNWMPADGGDLVSFLFPIYRFAAGSLAEGVWPLWNPYLYGGAPHVGDIQAGFLYLPNLLLFLFKPDFPYTALQWLGMAHIWFAGAGMYLLLAHGLGLRSVAALAGAVAFMFADPFLTHFGNLNLNAAVSWLPWIFWAWQRVLTDERIWAAARPQLSFLAFYPLGRVLVTSLLLALSITAGHIQATLLIVVGLGGYSALELWLARETPEAGRRSLRVGLALAGTLLGAALFTAPVLLPAFELAARSARVDWNYTAASGYSLSPAQWIGWLIPGFFGRGPQFHWGAWPRVEVGYLGILTLVLAGLSLSLPRPVTRRTWTLAGLAGASFVLALGIYAIPHGWLTLLPGFGQLRAPARFVWLTDFAVAALAATGLHAVLLRTTTARSALAPALRMLGRVTGGVWLLVIPLAYLALLLVQAQDNAIIIRISITLIAVVSFGGLLAAGLGWLWLAQGGKARASTLGWLAVGLIFLDVASLGAYQDLSDRNPSRGFEHPAIAAYLQGQTGPFRIDSRTQIESLWQPNTAVLYGLEDVTGVANPLVLADFERYWGALGSRSTALYDLLNVRYIVAAKDVMLDWDKYRLAFEGDPQLNVYENKRPLPRVFIAPHAVSQPTHELALRALQEPGFDVTQIAVIEGPAPVDDWTGGIVDGITTGRNRLAFRTSTEGTALVFVSQVWYPGWQVYIDGMRMGAPLRVNYLFQGVTAPPGEHQIEIRFEPASWRIGWWMAGITGLAGVIGWVVKRRGRKKDGD